MPCKEANLVSIVELTLLQDMLLCLAPFHRCQLAANTADMQDMSGADQRVLKGWHASAVKCDSTPCSIP